MVILFTENASSGKADLRLAYHSEKNVKLRKYPSMCLSYP